ncbi:MAG: long-chain fatty acid--CoA ligase, partial [Burkholderiales bacterium]
PLFEQAFVVGESRPYVGCVAVLNRDGWRALATRLGVDADDPRSLAAPVVQAAALERIRALTKDLPRYAMPGAVALTLEPWTVENTMLTPTLKLKRNDLLARFAEEIEGLYVRGGRPTRAIR